MLKSKNTQNYIIAGIVTLTAITLYLLYKGAKKGLGSKLSADNWSKETNFFNTSSGKNLVKLAKDARIDLKRNKGLNKSGYSQSEYNNYKNKDKIHWAVYDISNDKLISSSTNGNENVYGASVPKICLASLALDKNNGVFSNDENYEKIIKLIVKSDNNVWSDVELLAGGADDVNAWSQNMGYNMQPSRKKNRINAIGMCRYWNDVCRNKFKGSEDIFKISSSCDTSAGKSLKYLPESVYVGGKTGTWEQYNHDSCWIQNGDRFYSITVLSDGGYSSDILANMFRGLFDEHIKN